MIYLHSDNPANIGTVLSLQIQKLLADRGEVEARNVGWCVSYIVGSVFALNRAGAITETMKGVKSIFGSLGFTDVSIAEVVDIAGSDVIYITVGDLVTSLWVESKTVGIHRDGEAHNNGMNGVTVWRG